MRTKWSYIVTILIHGLLANVQSSDTNCDSPWNITIDGHHLQWTGEDRVADVVVRLTPDTSNGTGLACSNMTLNVPFSKREALIESQCANNFHLANATLVCGDSSSSRMEITQLQDDVPGALLTISVTEVTSTSITLEWLEPASSADIVGYSVRKRTENTSFTADVLHTVETRYTLGGLQPYTQYYMQVSPAYENGNGSWSNDIIERTKTSVPFPPAGVQKQFSTNSSILVKWKEPYPFVGPILKYTIKWERIEGSIPTETRDSNQTSYEMDELSAYTNYSVQVRANTEAGTGHWSKAVVVSTDIGVPTVPRNLSVTNTSSTCIFLSWEAPDPENGPILNYVVAWGSRWPAVSQVLASETQYEAKSLKPYTEYVFQVAARTEAGLGPFTEHLFVRTDIDLPSQPENLTSLKVTNTSILIEWDAPAQPNGPLLPYLVKVVEFDNNKTVEATSDFPNCTMEGLLPYVNYSVQVCAQTKAGRGEWTEELDFRTEIGIPTAPRHLSTPKILPTSIKLEWSNPESLAGPSLDYLLKWGVRGTTASLFVTTETSYEAIGLRPYTEYFFDVAARTEAGVGLSEILILYTDIAAPSVPGDITTFGTNESSIHFRWTPPQNPNGPNILYLVQWSELSQNLTLVDNITSTEYIIENLQSSTNYSVQIAAKTSVGQGPWTEVVYITTSAKGSGINLPLILGLVLGLALPLLILLIVGVVIMTQKGGLKFLSSISSPKTTKKEPSPYQYDNPPAQLGVYHLTPKSLTVQNFEERINRPMYSSRIEMVKEFGDLKQNSPQHSANVAKLEENLSKNRWGKMMPYDHSRVKLLPYGDKLKPDFINANYIPGDSYLLEYIASQGPLKETLDDFWTMIWQQSISVLVMLTQCVEKAVRNCEQYWPASGQSKIFGEIQVYTQSESVLSSYVVRVLAIQFRSQNRHVIHMHFSNWPVSGCPRTPDEFLHFTRKVREQTSERRPGPILVHCSAGVGRTGTFIAVDRLFQHLQHSDDIDIYGTVLDMRRYRPHMVHTEDQYIFIYDCVKRFLQERKEPQESLYEVAL